MTMFAKSMKVLIAALVLAGTSLTLVSHASAGPGQAGWYQGGESYLQDRHDATNTNGF
jgi:hypothetical protein